jgi:hypothetical protein
MQQWGWGRAYHSVVQCALQPGNLLLLAGMLLLRAARDGLQLVLRLLCSNSMPSISQ